DLKQKCRQRRRRKSQIARRHAKKINLLSRRKDPLSQYLRKNLAQPGAAREDKVLRLEYLAAPRSHRGKRSRSRALARIRCYHFRHTILHPAKNRVFHHRRHSP